MVRRMSFQISMPFPVKAMYFWVSEKLSVNIKVYVALCVVFVIDLARTENAVYVYQRHKDSLNGDEMTDHEMMKRGLGDGGGAGGGPGGG